MNHAVSRQAFSSVTSGFYPRDTRSEAPARPHQAWQEHEEATRVRRMHSLLGLFALYAVALLAVTVLSDGEDIGCVLGGIAGHVLYATARIVTSWRDAAWLEDAKARVMARLRPQLSF